MNEPEVTLTKAEREILTNLPDMADGRAYYCDINADYRLLVKLERRGYAGSRDRSDWWRTPAGAKAIALAVPESAELTL